MFGSYYFLQIFLWDVAFFVVVDESEECKWIEVGGVGDGLSVGLVGLVDESVLGEYVGEGIAGLDGEHVLLVVGHSRLLLNLFIDQHNQR